MVLNISPIQKIKKVAFLGLIIIISMTLFPKTVRSNEISDSTLSGYVRNINTGEGLPSAIISVIGTEQNAISNSEGFFKITTSVEDTVILRIEHSEYQDSKNLSDHGVFIIAPCQLCWSCLLLIALRCIFGGCNNPTESRNIGAGGCTHLYPIRSCNELR